MEYDPLFLFVVVVNSLFEEIKIAWHVFLIYESRGERFAFVVDYDMEWLRVGSELGALQEAPFIAVSTECAFCTIFLSHLDRFRKILFLIDHKGNEYEIIVDGGFYLRISPHGSLHLAAVDASIS